MRQGGREGILAYIYIKQGLILGLGDAALTAQRRFIARLLSRKLATQYVAGQGRGTADTGAFRLASSNSGAHRERPFH